MFAFVAVAASCSKNDDNNPVVPNPQPPTADTFVTAKVDGNGFSSFILGTSAAVCTKAGDLIGINSADLVGNSMAIALYGITATGTYNVNRDTDTFLAWTPDGANAQTTYSTTGCDGATGTIVIDVIDAVHVEGSFVFTGIDVDNCTTSHVITEGKFKGTFPQ